jgi:hypothetical protein
MKGEVPMFHSEQDRFNGNRGYPRKTAITASQQQSRSRSVTGVSAFLFFLFMLSFTVLPNSIEAKQWKPMSYEQLVSSSDLIITGKVVWINNEPVSTRSEDEATIMADKILKGSCPDHMVSLVYPGVNRGYETFDGKFKSTRTYDEVFFDIEQEGIWFLKKRGDKYFVDHPARFKPIFFLPKVENAIKSPGKKR